MKLEVISGRLVLSMSNGALIDPKIGEPYASQIVEEFNLAIAPQAPVSAVPVAWVRQRALDTLKTGYGGAYEVQVSNTKFSGFNVPLYASHPPPAQADEGKDAEIEHLKLEMDGVDNAKEEIGRLLGLTEEFRWKRISAAI